MPDKLSSSYQKTDMISLTRKGLFSFRKEVLCSLLFEHVSYSSIIVVGDRMFLRTQDFDFAQIYHFCPNIALILPKSNQFCPKSFARG